MKKKITKGFHRDGDTLYAGYYKDTTTANVMVFQWDTSEDYIFLEAGMETWKLLILLPELWAYMQEIGRKKKAPNIEEFSEKLIQMGFCDYTKVEPGSEKK